MRIFWNRLGIAVAAFGLMFGAMGQAQADTVLLSLVDVGPVSDVSYVLPFTATAATTTISIGGYQVPSFEYSADNGVYLGGGGPNLLGGTWTFTPAEVGSDSGTYNDGTSVPGLVFGGVAAGYYDTYSQTIATTPGAIYTVNLVFSNDDSGPDGFLVTTSAVPEPSSMVLAGTGALVVMLALARRRKATAAV
jgi:hypothetical protein